MTNSVKILKSKGERYIIYKNNKYIIKDKKTRTNKILKRLEKIIKLLSQKRVIQMIKKSPDLYAKRPPNPEISQGEFVNSILKATPELLKDLKIGGNERVHMLEEKVLKEEEAAKTKKVELESFRLSLKVYYPLLQQLGFNTARPEILRKEVIEDPEIYQIFSSGLGPPAKRAKLQEIIDERIHGRVDRPVASSSTAPEEPYVSPEDEIPDTPESKAKTRKGRKKKQLTKDDYKEAAESLGSGKLAKGLTNIEIDEIMKNHPGYSGTISIDQLKVPKGSMFSFIMNTMEFPLDGHWIAVHGDKNTLEYYDSFGDHPSEEFIKKMSILMKKYTKNLVQFKINSVPSQRNDSYRCGYHAIKFLLKRQAGESFQQATGYKPESNVKRGEKEAMKLEKQFGNL